MHMLHERNEIFIFNLARQKLLFDNNAKKKSSQRSSRANAVKQAIAGCMQNVLKPNREFLGC